MFLIALLVRTFNEKNSLKLMCLLRRLLMEEKTLEMTEQMFKMKLKGKTKNLKNDFLASTPRAARAQQSSSSTTDNVYFEKVKNKINNLNISQNVFIYGRN